MTVIAELCEAGYRYKFSDTLITLLTPTDDAKNQKICINNDMLFCESIAILVPWNGVSHLFKCYVPLCSILYSNEYFSYGIHMVHREPSYEVPYTYLNPWGSRTEDSGECSQLHGQWTIYNAKLVTTKLST